MRFGGPLPGDRRQQQVHAAETRLLYDNACTGIVATIVIAALLAYAQWNVKPPSVVLAWLLYVLLVSAARYVLVRRYRRASPTDSRQPPLERGIHGRRRDGGGRVGCGRDHAVRARPADE